MMTKYLSERKEVWLEYRFWSLVIIMNKNKETIKNSVVKSNITKPSKEK
jgi:hypothetical protein